VLEWFSQSFWQIGINVYSVVVCSAHGVVRDNPGINAGPSLECIDGIARHAAGGGLLENGKEVVFHVVVLYRGSKSCGYRHIQPHIEQRLLWHCTVNRGRDLHKQHHHKQRPQQLQRNF
jgi:hypothetical protein